MLTTGPAAKRYRIVVEGRLSESFVDGFDGLALTTQPGRSTLSGPFADQAQLYGLLNRLRDLGIELASVNVVE